MPPQSQDQAGPDRSRRGRADGDMSGRQKRKLAAEKAERQKRLLLIGGAVAAAVIVAVFLILLNRPQPAGSPIYAGDPLPASIPVEGTVMGAADAPVTVVEWGDYT
ncbi:MAG: hypothetical protein U0031_05890 [Thermomicrobiales bacterium]